jgi:hypothetical protein
MIEVAESNEDGELDGYLIVNGIEFTGAQAQVYMLGMEENSRIWVITNDPLAVETILTHKVSDVPPRITRLQIDTERPDTSPGKVYLTPTLLRDHVGRTPRLAILVGFAIHDWKHPWSMREATDAMKQRIEADAIPNATFDDHSVEWLVGSFAIVFSSLAPNATIGEAVFERMSQIRAIVDEVERDLAARMRPDSLVALFDFPVDVRVACEQYLLYFIEFLKDVGVEAEANITHDVGRVLFSVTPHDPTHALEKLREALNAYLGLPAAAALGDITSFASDPRTQSLVANIQHLQGQLMLANATLQHKDATIQLMSRSVALTQRAVAGDVVSSSLRLIGSSSDIEKDEEDVIRGIVKVSQFTEKGVTVNLAEMLRRFRKMFASEKPDDNSRSD